MKFFLAFNFFLLFLTTNAIFQGSNVKSSEELWKSFDKRLLELERQQEIIKWKIFKWIRTFRPIIIDQRTSDSSSLFEKEAFDKLFDVDILRSIKADMRYLIEANAAVIKVEQSEVVVKSDEPTERLPPTPACPKSEQKMSTEYCSQFTNSYTAYIPVNGTSFKFKARARYDATIGFASKAWETPTYDIMIGDYANSKTNLYKRENSQRGLIVESLTPGILDPCEYRGFWVSWENNIIRVGRQGNPAALLTHHVANLHPVNFIGIRTTVHSMGDWVI